MGAGTGVSNNPFSSTKSTKKIKLSAVISCLFATVFLAYAFTLKWFYTSQSELQKAERASNDISSQKDELSYQQRIQRLEEKLEIFDQMRDRVMFLETKLNSYLSFGVDPFIGFKVAIECKNISELKEYCPKPTERRLTVVVEKDDDDDDDDDDEKEEEKTVKKDDDDDDDDDDEKEEEKTVKKDDDDDDDDEEEEEEEEKTVEKDDDDDEGQEYEDYDCVVDQAVCLDDYPFKNGDEPCIVYDFGIRKEPEFGRILSKEPFNCKVFAFDPSPITKEWYGTSDLVDNPNYKLFDYGAGGEDGEIILREYNWNQITILQYPQYVVNVDKCDDLTCQMKLFTAQKTHTLPVRSLSSIMKELGHDKISILKLDIEGSEFRFLESMINTGVCRHVDQLTLEWHHYSYDTRYGTSSSPHINMFVELLDKRCGLKQFHVYDPAGGWPANDKLYTEMGMTLMYNLAAFRRDKSWSMEN